MLDKLGEGLRNALRKIAGTGHIDKAVVDELVKDIQRSLLAGDVDVKLVFELTKKIRERILSEKPPAGMTPREHAVRIVYEELVKLVGEKAEISLKPGSILLCGLFGSGKTTTAAKLARFYQKKGLRPALVCCDVERPAAYEQLQQLSEQIHVPFYGEKGNRDSGKILKNAMDKLKADVIIIDSSGRNALDAAMIKEIKNLYDIAKPDERILVIPADIGQAAKVQASEFQKSLNITGVIITKIEGTAKGGGALTACSITGAPVKWIGVGEKIDALEEFDPQRFVGRLIGWGDIQSLMEKAKEAIEPEKAGEMAEKLVSGKFTLSDFYEQIKGVQRMGSLKSVMEMIPGMPMARLPKDFDAGKQEMKMRKWKHAIESMTRKEREEPEIIDAPRIARISRGSGVPEAEIRELLRNYQQSKKMMRMLGGGMRRGPMAKLARKFRGF
ncbi:MAG: signal recognition particle protein Srp54 [Candidatus Aenigmatarchaeota archaeon]